MNPFSFTVNAYPCFLSREAAALNEEALMSLFGTIITIPLLIPRKVAAGEAIFSIFGFRVDIFSIFVVLLSFVLLSMT